MIFFFFFFFFFCIHFHFRSRRKTADAMRLPLQQFHFMYCFTFTLYCTVIVARINYLSVFIKKSVTIAPTLSTLGDGSGQGKI